MESNVTAVQYKNFLEDLDDLDTALPDVTTTATTSTLSIIQELNNMPQQPRSQLNTDAATFIPGSQPAVVNQQAPPQNRLSQMYQLWQSDQQEKKKSKDRSSGRRRRGNDKAEPSMAPTVPSQQQQQQHHHQHQQPATSRVRRGTPRESPPTRGGGGRGGSRGGGGGARANTSVPSNNTKSIHHRDNNDSSVSRSSRNPRSAKSPSIRTGVPTLSELTSVVFSPNNTFVEGEEVIIPRSRGGFTYGRIKQRIEHDHCFLAPDVSKRCDAWHVDYLVGNEPFFKQLPTFYVGKRVPSGGHSQQPAEPQSLPPPPPASDPANEGSTPLPRDVGTRPGLRDLRNVVFSTEAKFNENEVVLVPRSGGGFTYARLMKPLHVKCKLHVADEQQSNSAPHLVNAWRAQLTEPNGSVASFHKDVVQSLLGKVDLIGGPTTGSGPVHSRTTSSLEQVPEIDPRLASMKESDAQRELELAAERERERQRQEQERLRQEQEYRLLLEQRRAAEKLVRRRRPTNARVANEDEGEESERHIIPPLAIDDDGDLDDITKMPGRSFASDNEDEEEDGDVVQQLPEQAPSMMKPPTAAVASASSQPPPPTQAQPAPMLQVGGVLAVDKKELFKKLMQSSKSQSLTKPDPERTLIVIDGPNVAKNHGKDVEFSTIGIKIALDYWNKRGHDAIAFVPQHYLKRKPAAAGEMTLSEFMPRASNLNLLQQLVDSNRVVLTPPQDYDDDYCIEYAQRHDACILTNDRYNDHIDRQVNEAAKRRVRKWIRDHCISFTFVRDELLPNPKFEFPERIDEKTAQRQQQQQLARQHHRQNQPQQSSSSSQQRQQRNQNKQSINETRVAPEQSSKSTTTTTTNTNNDTENTDTT